MDIRFAVEFGIGFLGASGWCAFIVASYGAYKQECKANALRSDLADAAESIGYRDIAIAEHMKHIGDQRQAMLAKNQLIDQLEAALDKAAAKLRVWEPIRDARGHFVKKVR